MVINGAAYIFPGQGAQYVGMGKDLYDNFPQAKEIFDSADGIVDFDLKSFCFEGPAEKLSTTAHSQPAILTASIAALRSLESRAPKIDIKAALGLSLGEYSALVGAGSLDFREAVKLVELRGRFMEEASQENPGKMAAVLGLEKCAVDEICREAGCEIANLNCPGQIVISGDYGSIDRAESLAKKKDAKRFIVLEVSGPFHSSLMKGAADKLNAVLKDADIKEPRFSFVSNVTASHETESENIKRNLLAQLTSRTYWEDSIKLLAGEGVKIFLEIGPGRTLKGLLRKIDPSLIVYNIGTVEDIVNLASVYTDKKTGIAEGGWV